MRLPIDIYLCAGNNNVDLKNSAAYAEPLFIAFSELLGSYLCLPQVCVSKPETLTTTDEYSCQRLH